MRNVWCEILLTGNVLFLVLTHLHRRRFLPNRIRKIYQLRYLINTDTLARNVLFLVLTHPHRLRFFAARVSAPIGFSVKCVAATPSRCRSDTDFCDMLSGRQRQGGKCRIVCTLPLTTVVSMPLRQFPSRCRSDKNRSSVQGLSHWMMIYRHKVPRLLHNNNNI